jgi:hypothetical protein
MVLPLTLASLFSEWAELRARGAGGTELDELAARCHGRAASSTGIVLHIEAHVTQTGVRLIAVSVREEQGGGYLHYRVGGDCLASLPMSQSRDPSQRWPKGQRLVVAGTLDWPASLLPPCILVSSARSS